jgi:hypothetical protein
MQYKNEAHELPERASIVNEHYLMTKRGNGFLRCKEVSCGQRCFLLAKTNMKSSIITTAQRTCNTNSYSPAMCAGPLNNADKK